MESNKLKTKIREGFSCNDKGYLSSYTENIYKNEMDLDFQIMFDKGSGSELHSKAEAIHSSSMLSYNLFHWIKGNTFIFENVVYNKVYFEVQTRTLKCSNTPANMDVVLDGTDVNGKRHLLFIESKFTEYLENSKFVLSDSYKEMNNWYNKEIDWCSLIEKAAMKCSHNKCYGEGIKQAITHLFGIYGLKGDEKALAYFNKGMLKIEDINNVEIHFSNFIFEPDEKVFPQEHTSFDNYKNLYTEFIQMLPEGVEKPRIMSYSDVWEKMKPQINDLQLINYIEKRYMNYAKKQY